MRPEGSSLACVHPTRMSVVSQHRAGENVKNPAPQDTQTRSRLLIGDFGPSDSALAASSGWRLRRTVADRHAARCASRDLCSGGAPRRYPPSEGPVAPEALRLAETTQDLARVPHKVNPVLGRFNLAKDKETGSQLMFAGDSAIEGIP